MLLVVVDAEEDLEDGTLLMSSPVVGMSWSRSVLVAPSVESCRQHELGLTAVRSGGGGEGSPTAGRRVEPGSTLPELTTASNRRSVMRSVRQQVPVVAVDDVVRYSCRPPFPVPKSCETGNGNAPLTGSRAHAGGSE